jgi:Carboxypeptidase regulatory-like domain
VVAHRATDDAQFVATTDADGRYDFQSLAPGKYKISMDPIKSFQTDDANVEVRRGQCWDLTLSRSPHARLSGHVKRLDGSPIRQVPVLIENEDGSGYTTVRSDRSGSFHMEPMSPGEYVVGINLPGAPAWKYGGCSGECKVPRASLYYPNMRNRADAIVINLTADEQRDDIDFTIPAP